jgi:hypothetical protein
MEDENPRQEPARGLDIRQIMAILPHRYPFLLIDRVLELSPKRRIVAIKNVTINEAFFQGHFPEYAIMPGVLMVEAIAQAGGVLLLPEVPEHHTKLMVFFRHRPSPFSASGCARRSAAPRSGCAELEASGSAAGGQGLRREKVGV